MHTHVKKTTEYIARVGYLGENLQVIPLRSWLMFISIVCLSLAGLTYATILNIPITTQGTGIFLPAEGMLIEISAFQQGRLVALNVKTGDYVQTGDILGLIAQPVLEKKIDNSQKYLDSLFTEKGSLEQFIEGNNNLELPYAKNKINELHEIIKHNKEQREYLISLLARRNKLYKRGFISKKDISDTEQELNEVNQNISRASTDLSQMSIELHTKNHDLEIKLKELNDKILITRQSVDELKVKHKLASEITSPISGYIIELRSGVGRFVKEGDSLIVLGGQLNPSQLQITAYFPLQEGKRLKIGMRVRIAPSTVKPEEYGFIIGEIIKVSSYPISKQAIIPILNNEGLAHTLSAAGAPIEAIIKLNKPPLNLTEFEWTTSKGSPEEITQGTLATVLVTLEEKRPIMLLIPFLKGLIQF
jgi:HlyD family secretion protein